MIQTIYIQMNHLLWETMQASDAFMTLINCSKDCLIAYAPVLACLASYISLLGGYMFQCSATLVPDGRDAQTSKLLEGIVYLCSLYIIMYYIYTHTYTSLTLCMYIYIYIYISLTCHIVADIFITFIKRRYQEENRVRAGTNYQTSNFISQTPGLLLLLLHIFLIEEQDCNLKGEHSSNKDLLWIMTSYFLEGRNIHKLIELFLCGKITLPHTSAVVPSKSLGVEKVFSGCEHVSWVNQYKGYTYTSPISCIYETLKKCDDSLMFEGK